MSLKYYMDHNVPKAITMGLRLRGIDVLTAYEDHTALLADEEMLSRAAELQRILFTQDDDLLVVAAAKQKAGEPFYGVIYAHQLTISIGSCVKELELIAVAASPEDVMNKMIFLPLQSI